MRTVHDWFSNRAEQCWKAFPGRSFMVLTPPGCNEVVGGDLVVNWCLSSFVPPRPYENLRILPIRVTSDGVESSRQFANSFLRGARKVGALADDFEKSDYPSDIVLDVVEGCLARGYYPLLVLERFHAFAQIADGGLASVLSRLRSLEVGGQLTSIVFSSLTYEAIRRRMDGSVAFLNSVYGDAHELAVMAPISKPEFVNAALSKGLDCGRAHKAFAIAGGPDFVFESVLNAYVQGRERDCVAVCAEKCGAVLEGFFGKAFEDDAESGLRLLDKCVLGSIASHEVFYLRSIKACSYIFRDDAGVGLRIVSPVLTRWLVKRGFGDLSIFGACLERVREGEVESLLSLVATIHVSEGRVREFVVVSQLYGGLFALSSRAFLGVDWEAVRKAVAQLNGELRFGSAALCNWVGQISEWSGIAQKVMASGRLQLDLMTSKAADRSSRLMVMFMVANFLSLAELAAEDRCRPILVNLPESVLQCLAVGHCNFDFSCAPEDWPVANYANMFFGGRDFELPKKGSKITLLPLMVTVGAILQGRGNVKGCLVDPAYMRSVQTRLVDRIRNPSAHTIVDLDKSDSSLLLQVCRTWLDFWVELEGFSSVNEIPGFLGRPDVDTLEYLLVGRSTGAEGSSRD